jgi:hypothetical protein
VSFVAVAPDIDATLATFFDGVKWRCGTGFVKASPDPCTMRRCV